MAREARLHDCRSLRLHLAFRNLATSLLLVFSPYMNDRVALLCSYDLDKDVRPQIGWELDLMSGSYSTRDGVPASFYYHGRSVKVFFTHSYAALLCMAFQFS